jgi:excisionase family DNA binding protein
MTTPITNPDERIWHTTNTAAAYADLHRQTIADALRSGELVGAQRTDGGHWRIHVDDLDAWLRGGTR